jgi:hypothetical protein
MSQHANSHASMAAAGPSVTKVSVAPVGRRFVTTASSPSRHGFNHQCDGAVPSSVLAAGLIRPHVGSALLREMGFALNGLERCA